MQALKTQSWATPASQELITRIASQVDSKSAADVQKWIEELAQENHRLHDIEGINLNPATNILNPRAEKMLSSGMGSRASLGLPGDKYETGLGAIEQIEIITQELACEVFGSTYAEFRVPSGAIANLYAFMANTEPGDTIIAPRHLLVATLPTIKVALQGFIDSIRFQHLLPRRATQSISMP